MKTKVCIVLVCLTMMASSMYATVINGVCGEHLTWTLNSEDSTLVITGRGDMSGWTFGDYASRVYIKHIVFPEGMTSVYGRAFSNCTALESVTLPDSVITIGNNAFENCGSLRVARLGKNVRTIEQEAFRNCSALKHLELSDSLESIGVRAFNNCVSLTDTVVFPETLSSIGGNAFGGDRIGGSVAVWKARHCQTGEIATPMKHFAHVVFGDKVEYIGPNLFSNALLDTVILPASVDTIEHHAFYASGLSYIELPPSLVYIGSEAFYGNLSLKSLVIPENISTIPGSMCGRCSALETVTLPDGLQIIGEFAFSNCSVLQRCDIPTTVQTIGNGAFSSCSSLPSVTLPEGMTRIADIAFHSCNMLKEVHFPQSLTTIGDGSFQGCAIDSLGLPPSLNTIGEYAFLNLVNLKELIIPDEVRQIKSRAFEGCSGLKKVVIGKKTAMIDADAFKNDYMLKEIHSRAAYPPLVESSTFAGVPDSTWLFVPVQSIAAYAEDPVWGRFRMPKEEEINYVTVDAEETTANFVWPTDSTASSYRIDIYKNGEVFCKLTLGKTGQLLGISFNAPSRSNPGSTIPASLSFMVTGLDEATRYNYVLSALSANGTPVHVYTGAFATIGYPGELEEGGKEIIPTPPIIPTDPESHIPTGVDNEPSDQVPNTKVILNGQIYLMYEGRMYDVQGKRIE